MRASTHLGLFRTAEQWEGWRVPWGTWDSSACTEGEWRCHFCHFSDSEYLNLMLWHVLWAWTFISLVPALSQVLCCYSHSSIWWLNLSNRTFCSFFLRLDSMEIAPLQHKSRPNLPFSPAWWLQHGKEVCLYLRPGLGAVTSARRGSLCYTGSMSVWQGQLTSFHLAANVLQGVRKMFPFVITSTPVFHAAALECCLCSVCVWGCCHHLTWLPQLSPWARGEVESSLSSWSALSRSLPGSLGGYLRSHR